MSVTPSNGTGEEPLLTMSGDVDIATEADWVRRGLALLDEHPGLRDLPVDMRDVVFIDSRGMAALVALHAAALERGGRLSLRSIPDRVSKAITLAGLDSVFDVAP